MTYETQALFPSLHSGTPSGSAINPLNNKMSPWASHDAAAHTVPCDVITILPLCKNRLSKAEKKIVSANVKGLLLANHSMVRQRPGYLSQIGDKLRSITLQVASISRAIRSAHLPSSGHWWDLMSRGTMRSKSALTNLNTDVQSLISLFLPTSVCVFCALLLPGSSASPACLMDSSDYRYCPP